MPKTELVTTLKKKATELISQIQRERGSILITHYGKPAAYLVDVESYERLQSRIALLEGVARGERALLEGRVVTHTEAKRKMARWLK